MSVVEGTLSVNGQPAGNAAVAFHPVGGDPDRPYCPVGYTKADGTFRLSTFAPEDGAPPGEYAVTLIWHDPSKPVDECECIDPAQHDLLFGKYTNAETSPLRVRVVSGRNSIPLFASPGTPKPQPKVSPRARESLSGVFGK